MSTTIPSLNDLQTSKANATTAGENYLSTSGQTITANPVNLSGTNVTGSLPDSKLATITTGGKVANSATTATNANTPSTIVSRDGSGNFSAGTISANLNGTASNVTTNANLTGDVTSVGNATTIATVNSNVGSFGNGTNVGSFTVNAKGQITAASNVPITGAPPSGSAGGDLSGTYPNPTVSKINGSSLGSTTPTAGNLLVGSGTSWDSQPTTGDVTINSSGVTAIGSSKVTNAMLAGSIADSKLLTISTAGKVSNSATTATSSNTASAIVARDSNGDFSAGTITASKETLNNGGAALTSTNNILNFPFSTVGLGNYINYGTLGNSGVAAGNVMFYARNLVYDSTAFEYKYVSGTPLAASLIEMSPSAISLKSCPLGTAGNTATPTTVLNTNVLGQLLFPNISASGVLSVDASNIVTSTPTLSGTLGGTGVNNGSNTITLGGNLATSGAFNSTFAMTAATSVTFPTSGTLLSAPNVNTNSGQPSFGAHNGTTRTDVTGDGTVYTLIFNTEDFDQANNFDGTSTFTAPVTGKYQFNVVVLANGITSSHTQYILSIVTSVATYEINAGNAANLRDSNNNIIINGSIEVNMSANDTAVAKFLVANGTKVVDISNTPRDTYFSGFLVC